MKYCKGIKKRKRVIEKARKVAYAAGLDGRMIGIHPHNAMVSYEFGNPWPNVNYKLVRKCLKLLDKANKVMRKTKYGK